MLQINVVHQGSEKILKRQSNQASRGKNVYYPRHLEAIKIGS